MTSFIYLPCFTESKLHTYTKDETEHRFRPHENTNHASLLIQLNLLGFRSFRTFIFVDKSLHDSD